MKKNFFLTAELCVLISSFVLTVTSCTLLQSFCDTEEVSFEVEDSSFSKTLKLVLKVEKSRVTPVLVFLENDSYSETPVVITEENAVFYKTRIPCENLYGTIYPFSNRLTKQDAFASDILQTLYFCSKESGSSSQLDNYLARFNWERFLEKIREKENPWNLDRQKILSSIASGTFKVTDLQ